MSNYACNENSFFYVIKEDNYNVLVLVLQCSYFFEVIIFGGRDIMGYNE